MAVGVLVEEVVLAMGAMAKDAVAMGVLAEEVVLAMGAMAKDAMAMGVLAEEVVLAMAKDASSSVARPASAADTDKYKNRRISVNFCFRKLSFEQ